MRASLTLSSHNPLRFDYLGTHIRRYVKASAADLKCLGFWDAYSFLRE